MYYYVIHVCLPHIVSIQLLLVNIVKWLFWLRLGECLFSGCVQVLFWIHGHNIVRLFHGFFNIVTCCFKYGTQTFDQQCCPMCLNFFLKIWCHLRNTSFNITSFLEKSGKVSPKHFLSRDCSYLFMITVKVLLAVILEVILGTSKLAFPL